MCRLYGFLANEPTKVECTLVHAQNALLQQSRADLRGKAHPDGWGISCYPDGIPQRERRETAAHEGLWFSAAAERVYSHAVVAHVRRATVGGAKLENTHPFTHLGWTFAHNGTVTAFARVAAELARETDPALWKLRQGTTDSEAVFYWLLSRMVDGGIALDEPSVDAARLVAQMSAAVRCLAARSAAADADEPAQLNLLLTNGRLLVASRWKNSLYYVQRVGVHDCEICGIPHIRHSSDVAYRAVVVASEPISHEPWTEVPDQSILVAATDGRLDIFPLTDRPATVAAEVKP